MTKTTVPNVISAQELAMGLRHALRLPALTAKAKQLPKMLIQRLPTARWPEVGLVLAL